jgi:hypothetical protein
VANWWLLSYGWPGLIGFKAATVLLATGLLAVVIRRRPVVGMWALNVSCLAVGAVVLYSACLLGHHHEALAALQRAQRQDAEVEQKLARWRGYTAFQRRLDQDVIARRCSLGEAVDRLSHSEQAADPAWRAAISYSLTYRPEEQRLAAYIMQHAVTSLAADDPAAARQAAGRLEAEYRTTFGRPPPSLVCDPPDAPPAGRGQAQSHSASR